MLVYYGVREDGRYPILSLPWEKKHMSCLTLINDLEEAMECAQIANDTQLGNSQYAGGCSEGPR